MGDGIEAQRPARRHETHFRHGREEGGAVLDLAAHGLGGLIDAAHGAVAGFLEDAWRRLVFGLVAFDEGLAFGRIEQLAVDAGGNAADRALALAGEGVGVEHRLEAHERGFSLQAELVELLDEARRIRAAKEAIGEARRRRAQIRDIGAEIGRGDRRVDFLDDLAAALEVGFLEGLRDVVTGHEVGRHNGRILGEILRRPFAHGVGDLPVGHCGAEEIRQAQFGKVRRARAGADPGRAIGAEVVDHGEGHMGAERAHDDLHLVALHEFAQFLQADLRIKFIVLAQDLHLATSDHAVVLVEIEHHALEGGLAEDAITLRIDIQRADLDGVCPLGDGGAKGALKGECS